MTTTIQTTTNKIVDIHNHIIFDIDDGAKTLTDSLKALKEIQSINIDKLICTPHFSKTDKDKISKIKENYIILRKEAKKMDIDLYLGTEILLTSSTAKLLEQKKLRTLNGGRYILVELKRSENTTIDSILIMLEDIVDLGYIPVLAHPELYVNYRKMDYIKRIKELGVLLQLDASSIIKNKTKRRIYKFSKKLLKNRLIDVVASDSHCNTKRNFINLDKAYKIISKKYDQEYADIIFKTNPNIILNEKR
ncbi:MAG: hypothetical protein PHN42_02090 [Bacilli bacterium]|nr:hypothetical protein [Bacilli bacterium]